MATTKSTPTQAEPANELTPQEIVNEGIARVIEATGIDVQKNRYKAMRAIAWQSFAEAIKAGTFDALVAAAIANVEQLPSGWGIVASAKPVELRAPLKKATSAAKGATR